MFVDKDKGIAYLFSIKKWFIKSMKYHGWWRGAQSGKIIQNKTLQDVS
jgi:hypothetical protein